MSRLLNGFHNLLVGAKYVLSKGAETAILNRCKTGDVDSVERHITDYAKVSIMPKI